MEAESLLPLCCLSLPGRLPFPLVASGQLCHRFVRHFALVFPGVQGLRVGFHIYLRLQARPLLPQQADTSTICEQTLYNSLHPETLLENYFPVPSFHCHSARDSWLWYLLGAPTDQGVRTLSCVCCCGSPLIEVHAHTLLGIMLCSYCTHAHSGWHAPQGSHP